MHPEFEPLTISNKLAYIKHNDPEFKNFGANYHKYMVYNIYDDEILSDYEKSAKFDLPSDYKMFITEIGNGGAGPFYGVFPFGYHDSNHELCTWEDGYLIGDLSKPFPHTESWDLSDDFWSKEPNIDESTSPEEEDILIEEWNDLLEKYYWNPEIMNGAIPICHEGCAIRIWLVVNGPMIGQLWEDLRADQQGIHPLKDTAGNIHSFSSWYLEWLNNPLKI